MPRVCFGGTKSQMGKAESLGCQMNVLIAEQLGGPVEASRMLNGSRMGDVGHADR